MVGAGWCERGCFIMCPIFLLKKGGEGTKYKKNVDTILYVILDVVQDSSLMLKM